MSEAELMHCPEHGKVGIAAPLCPRCVAAVHASLAAMTARVTELKQHIADVCPVTADEIAAMKARYAAAADLKAMTERAEKAEAESRYDRRAIDLLANQFDAATAPPKRSRIKVKPRKNPMPPGRRDEIIDRDDGACRSCHRHVGQYAHVHHIVYLSHGVDHSPANLITLCGECHLNGIHAGKLWIIGNADNAEFVTENPKGKI